MGAASAQNSSARECCQHQKIVEGARLSPPQREVCRLAATCHANWHAKALHLAPIADELTAGVPAKEEKGAL